MFSLLRSGRWQAFTAAAVIAIVAFGLLSVWQWHRAEQKRAEFAVVEQALTADAVPADQVTEPSDWQRVTATGEYDPSHQYLVRNRPQDGTNGFWVVTLLRAAPQDVWVVRGWTPVQLSAAAGQTPPEPATGSVTVDGYVRLSEAGPLRAGTDLPPPQISSLDVAELDADTGQTTQPWFVTADNDPQLQRIPVPEPTDSRNVSYAGQWMLFAAITIGGWFYFLRREASDTAEQRSDHDVPVTSGH